MYSFAGAGGGLLTHSLGQTRTGHGTAQHSTLGEKGTAFHHFIFPRDLRSTFHRFALGSGGGVGCDGDLSHFWRCLYHGKLLNHSHPVVVVTVAGSLLLRKGRKFGAYFIFCVWFLGVFLKL